MTTPLDVVRLSISSRFERGPVIEESPALPEDERMDQQREAVDQIGRQQRAEQVGRCRRCRGPDQILLLSSATVVAGSPGSTVEFCQGRGSVRVLDTTYFCTWLRWAVNGLSV